MANVNGVFNAIYVVGDFVGETMFFGEGAGAGAAASAVMGDVLEVARHVDMGYKPLPACSCTDDLKILPIEDLSMKYYIRFSVSDKLGVLATMADTFARHNVSVFSMVQRGAVVDGVVDVIYVTHTARESDIREAVDEIKSMNDILHADPSIIRVEE